MLGVENFPSALPLDPICRVPSLDHGHESSWWWECFFFDDQLTWFDDMLDRSGLVALLHHVCQPIRWWWWCVVSHATCNWLFRLHLLLKHLTEPKKLPALDEEMCGIFPPVLVDVGVPGTPPLSISSAKSGG
jgi:hypothetical protein